MPDNRVPEHPLEEHTAGSNLLSCSIPALPVQTISDSLVLGQELKELSTSIAADSQNLKVTRDSTFSQNELTVQHRVPGDGMQGAAVERLQPTDDVDCSAAQQQNDHLNPSTTTRHGSDVAFEVSAGEHRSLV